ncbi:MAG: MarC family protein [Desulfurococcales archaeon]|nr:MarC family protein [Desulfurococcales archaeon]MEB3789546.1 MarC family protein [Desulfurococcales archaeon]
MITEIILLYGQIVAIMNPFTALNNYLTLTETMDKEEALTVLKHAMLVVLLLGLTFTVAGRLILEFYHLSLASLRLGGGILLLYISIDMLSGQPKTRSVEGKEVAVVPLATPMIVGPGTMTLLIHLGTISPLPHVVGAFLLSLATIAFSLRASQIFKRMLGRNGIKAMARFMALIIASVAAEMIHGAVVEWLVS